MNDLETAARVVLHSLGDINPSQGWDLDASTRAVLETLGVVVGPDDDPLTLVLIHHETRRTVRVGWTETGPNPTIFPEETR